jgi:hypothetical protein
MLYPKQTNCSCAENGNINSLISSIDCRLSKLANTMYNNTVFMLNKTISGTEIFDLIQYKRILYYKQINSDYVDCFSVNQIASQVKRFTANCTGNCNDSNIFPAPPIRTTTTTSTTPCPTTTSTSTTTTTTTIKVIDCGESSEFTEGVSYPTTQSITLGSVIGTVVLDYDTQGIPDRFIVEWNGNVVIDTGYRGSNAYDFGGPSRTSFNSYLTGKIDPITLITYPNFTNYPLDGYPRVLSPEAGTAFFVKNLPTSTSATVKVYSPTPSKVWLYTLFCPATTTTTTTTIVPEDFIIVANNVDKIARTANPAIIITSLSNFKIIWEPGDEELFSAGTNIPISHTYLTPYSGNVIIQAVDLSNITSLTIQSTLHTPPGTLSVTTSEIGKLDGLETFVADLFNGIFVDGIVAELPPTLITLNIGYTNITGTTLELPLGLTTCSIRDASIITGTAADLPNVTISLNIQGGNTISGNVADLPKSTVDCVITGSNTLSGNTSDLPTPSNLLVISGNNTITGDVGNISKALQVEFYGQNTISGNISGFTNLNTITSRLVLTGFNTVTGNIADFTNLLTLQRLQIEGNSSFSGNLSSLPVASPTPILSFVTLVPIGGPGNTFNGSTSTLPASLTSLQVLSAGTFTGDLISLPLGIQRFSLTMNTDLTYNLVTTRTWASGFYAIALPSITGTGWAGFTKDETDKLLIEIAASYTTTVNILINRFQIKCGPAPKRSTNLPPPPPPVLPPPTPTPEGAAVDAAVATIEAGLGTTITLY